MLRHTSTAALLAVVALAANGGCRRGGGETTGDNQSTLLAQDGSDANEVVAQSSSLTASFTLPASPIGPLPTSDQVVAAATNTHTYFIPSGCLTVTPDSTNHKVTYAFNACTGPWGLVTISGAVVATYTSIAATATSAAALQIDVGGDTPGTPATLQLNRATATYQATGLVTAGPRPAVDRKMTWTGTIEGTTKRGRPFSHVAHRNAEWTIGTACVTHDGDAEGKVGDREVDVTVTGYTRCRGECPSSGDVSIVEKPSGATVDLKFDGGDLATFTGVDGKSYEIVLACGI
jgi:hypothetical protein